LALVAEKPSSIMPSKRFVIAGVEVDPPVVELGFADGGGGS
jgi:hypothetical protein